MNQNITIFKDPETLADRVCDRLMELIADSFNAHFHLAISGGSTPNFLFSALARKFPDSPLWQKTHFWWVDERMVPSDNPDSNFGTTFRLLFSKIAIPEKNIHRIRGEEQPSAESVHYSCQIRENLTFHSGWPVFDLILLGMGEDGHTASIFPNQMELLQSVNISETAHHPLTGQLRVTLTGPVLNHAAHIWFLVTGAGKARRLAEIFAHSQMTELLPAAQINPASGELRWFADEQAAALLS